MRNKMKTYWFHVFLSGIDRMTDEIADALFEAVFHFSKVEIDPESLHELYFQSRNVA